MLSSSLEKYLVTLYELLDTNKELKVSDLAKQMNQSLQKTIQALQRMHYQKQVVYSPYQPLKLTDEGRKMAEYLIARNTLLDEFLKILHIEKNAVGEREVMAQYLSYESLEKIERFVMFNRQYPEISQRFELLLQMPPKNTLLPPLPTKESSEKNGL